MLFFVLIIFFTSCSNFDKQKAKTADEIIQIAIDSSGTYQINQHLVQFQFRDKLYRSIPTCNGLELLRLYETDSVKIVDELIQGKFKRYKDGEEVKVSDSLAFLYSESINSVHYFIQLPYRLTDGAVQKELIGKEIDARNEYYKIKVTFQENGGGEDFQDVYYFWIHSENFQIAYLAYSFQVNGGGIRFRKAIKHTKVNEIQFIDYENYQPKFTNAKLENSLFDYLNNNYELLSTIENFSILVEDVELICD